MIRRRKPIARRSKPRRGPLRSESYRAFIRHTGVCPACQVASMTLGGPEIPLKLIAGFQGGFCDAAHTENGGMRMKGPDSSCVPLCRVHHREYDSGRTSFERKYALDMKRLASEWWYLFQHLNTKV